MSKQRGLRFRKMDLHTHTPASRCYEYPDHTAERIVRTAMGKGLDAIAVTDHNTAAWIDNMKAAAEGTPLVVLPGVEISTHEGYHVVALFDTDVGQADVENFLGAIGITPPRYGRSDALCEKGIYDVLDVVHERGGLAILAHIDEPKGAFHELTTRDAETGKVRVPFPCASLFNDERYDAVEVTQGRLPDGFDALHNVQRQPPYYQASDSPCPENPLHHSDEGLAQRYTWFNLDEIRLEGIRQCFADPEVRICQMDELEERTRPHLVRMSVGPAGFLAYQRFHFHPGLNSIIGGKGVGKSLAIEFLRFALDQPSEHSDIHDDHLSKIEARLGAFNSVEVEFKLANGATYVLERTCQGNGESTFKCTNSETGEQYTGSVAHLFPILAYSQTEVIKIAESEGAQLRLLDALIDPRPFQKAIAELQEKLVENNRLVAEALDARVRTDECRGEIATLQEEIKNIDRLLSAAFLAQMKSAEAKRESFDQQSAYLDGLLALSQEYAEKVSAGKPAPVPEELADDPALQSQCARSRAARQYALDTLAAIGDRLGEERDAVRAAKSVWMPEFEAIREEYEQELCGSDHAQLEAQRRQLVKHVAMVGRDMERHRKQAEEDLPRLLQHRASLLDRLDQEHLAYFELRRKKFDGLTQASNGRLRLTLAHAANRASYTEALVDLLKGRSASTVSVANRRRITTRLSPRELGDVIIAHDVKALAKGAGLNLEMAERAMSKLWGHDDFTGVLAIQHAYYPEDTPSIQFNKGHGEYADLGELSVGQKCTALLIIALCDGDMPVIIDQPEDALDIASVWEDIAKKLRRGKYSRQFILTTHNSSLAVGSDSDEFMVLTPLSADRAKVSYRGAIDRSDVRQAVIDHLEGGPEPYKLRQRKYNIR